MRHDGRGRISAPQRWLPISNWLPAQGAMDLRYAASAGGYRC
jgi:hypothetical protein